MSDLEITRPAVQKAMAAAVGELRARSFALLPGMEINITGAQHLKIWNQNFNATNINGALHLIQRRDLFEDLQFMARSLLLQNSYGNSSIPAFPHSRFHAFTHFYNYRYPFHPDKIFI